MSLLFQNGTIEALARTLRGEREVRPASPLVALRASGHLPPFFCVHPAGGSVLSYYALAQHLDPERPFYGLQAWEGAAVTGALETVEEMADVYLEAVTELFPDGPYHLGGWSFGALVAFEMAQRLRSQGKEVASVVLMDTPAPGLLPAGADDAAVSLAFLASEAGLQVTAEELRRLDPESLVAHLADLTAAAGLLERESAAELVRRRLAMHEASMRAVREYAPQPYPGRLTIIRASEMLGPRVADHPAVDSDYGWRRYAAGPVAVHVVPGTHRTMMQEPHVHDLARVLREALREALTRHVSLSTP